MPFASHSKAYVCIHIIDRQAPVLLVCRADGDWQFLCGGMHEPSQARVVGIDHVVEWDPSLKELEDLPSDWEAERTAPDAPWLRTKIEPGA